jgi:CelD/BcsL family acetyltransferase involved in cellulose biosynthesis
MIAEQGERFIGSARLLQPDEWGKWDQLVESHDLGTVYHTSAWKDLIQTVYKHEPRYLVLEKDRTLVAGLPLFLVNSSLTGKRLECLPCAQSANPLVSSQEQYDLLIEAALQLKTSCNARYLELKTSGQENLTQNRMGKSQEDYCTFVLDMEPPEEQIFRSLHRNCTQRAIEKASRSGLQLIVGDSLEAVQAFYQFYLEIRCSIGLLPQPRTFFTNMWNIFYPKGWMDVLLASHAGKMVAGVVILRYKDTSVYEYGGSLPDSLPLRPNHLLIWEAIKQAKRQGYKQFDFGRTSLGNTGLMEFKGRWGTRQQQLHYYHHPGITSFVSLRQKKTSTALMNLALCHLPRGFCEFLGTHFYRHLI